MNTVNLKQAEPDHLGAGTGGRSHREAALRLRAEFVAGLVRAALLSMTGWLVSLPLSGLVGRHSARRRRPVVAGTGPRMQR